MNPSGWPHQGPIRSVAVLRDDEALSLALRGIVIVQGEHEDIASGNELPFQYVDKVGVGASAVVDKVESRCTGQVFAHKIFRPSSSHDRTYKTAFKNEISIMRRLQSHHHVIKIHWSYTLGRELGILLTPVASDKDLGSYLLAIRDSGSYPTSEQTQILYRAFGCLSSGLAYIHSHTIRHKDIKPQNILIHHGCIIYTDFGIAYDANDQCTTTTGMSEVFTKRYCAPEVSENQPRNRKSDVFSLGCVFLEIAAVLFSAVDGIVSNSRPYCTRVAEIRTIISCLVQEIASKRVVTVLSACLSVMHNEGELRPNAQLLVDGFTAAQSSDLQDYFCCSCIPVSEDPERPVAAMATRLKLLISSSPSRRENNQSSGYKTVSKGRKIAFLDNRNDEDCWDDWDTSFDDCDMLPMEDLITLRPTMTTSTTQLTNWLRSLFSPSQRRRAGVDTMHAISPHQSTRYTQIMAHGMLKVDRITRREMISIRIVTIIALIFLPATFVSTLFGTNIVLFEPPRTENFDSDALKLFLGVSLSLTTVTLLVWYVVRRTARRGDSQIPLEMINTDLEKSIVRCDGDKP